MTSRAEIILRFYLSFRGRKPRFFEVLTKQPRSWWLTVGFLLIYLLIGSAIGGYLSFFIFGIVGGALGRDVGKLVGFRRDWPTLDKIIDWPKAESELARITAQALNY